MTPLPSLLTIKEAAARARCNESTIKRDLSAGRYPGARRDDSDRNGAWLVPLADLVAAGRYRQVPEPERAAHDAEQQGLVDGLLTQLERETSAHRHSALLLATALAELTAERRFTATLERLLARALRPSGPGVTATDLSRGDA